MRNKPAGDRNCDSIAGMGKEFLNGKMLCQRFTA
jgi:hypothetical protein